MNKMIYLQEKRGQKLHLVFEAEGKLSQPICGKQVSKYRMTINVPMGYSCKNCNRIYAINKGIKTKKKFYDSLIEVK